MTSTSFLTRRDFLRGAAAAAVAVPMMVPRRVLGGDQPGPGEKVTVGMIGLGMQADGFHIPSLLGLKDVRVLAVCDVDTNRRRHAKQRVEEHYGADAGVQGLRRVQRLPRGARPQGHRRRPHRHARPLARHPVDRGLQGGQGRLLREAADADHRRGRR